MEELLNQAYFWQKLDTLYLSSDFVITNPKGSSVDDYAHIIYPCDFGYLKILREDREKEILCYKGSDGEEVNEVVICCNILEKSIDVKLLVGCNPEEQEAILRFLNILDQQKAILIRRTDATPSWAISEE